MSQYPNIAFIGKAGAGKTEARKFLQELALPIAAQSYEWHSFAEPLKLICRQLFGEGSETDRDLLQWFGTDVVRARNEDAWVDIWRARLENSTSGWPKVCDDLRFPNEWWAAKAEGFVIVEISAPRYLRDARLKANGKWSEEYADHQSENALAGLYPDFVIENVGSKWELMDALVELVNRLARK